MVDTFLEIEGIVEESTDATHQGSINVLAWGRGLEQRTPTESREGKQRDYEKVAENYRQLVLSYEAKWNFDTAEDFHIGEMEMRRKKNAVSGH